MEKKARSWWLAAHGLLIFLFLSQAGCFAQMQAATPAPGNQKLQAMPAEQNKIEEEIDEKYVWDFGKVKEGETLVHVFSLKNESSKVLQINGLNTSCGCTTSEVKKKTLQPQESTDIEVKFNTKGFHGLTKKFIYVNTDDVDNPVIRLIIKAEVIKEDIIKEGNTEVK